MNQTKINFFFLLFSIFPILQEFISEKCRKAFYNEKMLQSHMKKHHTQCYICSKDNPMYYFKNKNDLFDHAMNKHVVCMHPSCIQKQNVFFSSDFELNKHIAFTHDNYNNQSTELNFDLNLDSSEETNIINQLHTNDNEIQLNETKEQNENEIEQLQMMDETDINTTHYITQMKEQQQNFDDELHEILGSQLHLWKTTVIQFSKGKMIPECFLDQIEQLIPNESQRNSILMKFIQTQCDCRKKALLQYTIDKRIDERKLIRNRSLLHQRQWGRFQQSIKQLEQCKNEGLDSLWICTSICKLKK